MPFTSISAGWIFTLMGLLDDGRPLNQGKSHEVKAPNSWTLFCTKFTLHMMFKLGQCAEKKWR